MLDHASFRYVESWQNMTRDDSASVREFWRKENTNVRGQVADQRVCQIVIRVLAHNGELVAVSTAEPQIIPRLMQPMYYYRCFIGAAWRQHKLMRPLIRHSFDTLERWAGGQDFPCIGLLLELENPAFRHALQLAHWRTGAFQTVLGIPSLAVVPGASTCEYVIFGVQGSSGQTKWRR